MTKDPITEIKQLDWNDIATNGLTGISGKVYRIETKLNADRYFMLSELIPELEYGIGLKSTYAELGKIAADFNTSKMMDGMIKLHKLQTNFYQAITRKDVVGRIAAMFLVSEGEDLSDVSDSLIESKLTDWRQYEFIGFFTLCNSFITGLRENLSDVSQSGLNLNPQSNPKK